MTFAAASKALLRLTVLEAANRLAADRPWSAVTMAQIAKEAGVSRQTLYNEFGTRDELAFKLADAVLQLPDDPVAGDVIVLGHGDASPLEHEPPPTILHYQGPAVRQSGNP